MPTLAEIKDAPPEVPRHCPVCPWGHLWRTGTGRGCDTCAYWEPYKDGKLAKDTTDR